MGLDHSGRDVFLEFGSLVLAIRRCFTHLLSRVEVMFCRFFLGPYSGYIHSASGVRPPATGEVRFNLIGDTGDSPLWLGLHSAASQNFALYFSSAHRSVGASCGVQGQTTKRPLSNAVAFALGIIHGMAGTFDMWSQTPPAERVA